MIGLAEMCKECREKMRLSQKKMAELIGTNQTEISFIERGFIPSDSSKIERIYSLYDKNVKG